MNLQVTERISVNNNDFNELSNFLLAWIDQKDVTDISGDTQLVMINLLLSTQLASLAVSNKISCEKFLLKMSVAYDYAIELDESGAIVDADGIEVKH